MKKKVFDIKNLRENSKECFICGNKISEIDVIYENDDVIAFLDAYPPTKAYTLVSLKKHYNDIPEVPADLYARLQNTVFKVAKAIKKAYNPGRICLLNSGDIATHFHFHLIPMYVDIHDNLIDAMLKKQILTLTVDDKIQMVKEIKKNLKLSVC